VHSLAHDRSLGKRGTHEQAEKHEGNSGHQQTGVIVARIGRGGFEAYAADDHCRGLFPTPREAAAAITTTRPWVAERST